MKVWGKIHKNNKIIGSSIAESNMEDTAQALLKCLETINHDLNLAEPVWVKKHASDLSKFGRTKFLPEDYIESINFDYFEIELILE